MRLVIKKILFISLILNSLCVLAYQRPSAPVQPAMGYGGKHYNFHAMKIERIGIQSDQYFLFTPSKPTPKSAGMIIFLHDRMATNPKYYTAWLRHLCLRGWIIVFPQYQGEGDPEKDYLFNAIRDVKNAMEVLFKKGQIKLNKDKIAIIGHGTGATVGANIAATSYYFGIPTPKALMFAMPSKQFMHLKNLSGISPKAKMLVIVGDKTNDEIKNTARQIFYAAKRIKSNNKNYLTFLSDFHGSPPVVADREAPRAPELPSCPHEILKRRYEFVQFANTESEARHLRTQPVDAMDWYGTFRLFDAMAANVFEHKLSEDAFGNTPQQRFMGYWSDGRRLRGLLSSVRP